VHFALVSYSIKFCEAVEIFMIELALVFSALSGFFQNESDADFHLDSEDWVGTGIIVRIETDNTNI
jgi:hypothetical protein